MNGKVVVVGSFMMDLVVKAERRPKTGETLVGESFGMFIGGKGNNQAIAAARFGSQVHMVGKLGQDSFADQFLDNHKLEGINSDFIIQDPNVGTGVANPFIDTNADNSIIIIPRANMTLTPNAVSLAEKPIAEADVLLLQLEIPINASKRAAEIAQANGTIVILNPAPAQEIPDDFIQLADILTPNEVETEMLTGIPVTDENSAEKAAQFLIEKGVKIVILTLGGRGAFVAAEGKSQMIPAFKVKPIDTTAAGDSFCGVLAASLAEELDLSTAVKYATAAGGLAVTKMGAEPSLPSLKEVLKLANGS